MFFFNSLKAWYGSLRVCVIGSGPSGFYTAQRLLKQSKNIYIDMIEAKREPFGLIRFGVTPDHPEVKNCTLKFKELLLESPPRLSWYGGIVLGKDVKLEELTTAYHAVVVAIGAQLENRLNVPGEDTMTISSRTFTHWLNGDNEATTLSLSSTSSKSALIVGNGNVALDAARTLIGDPKRFSGTCIGPGALKELESSPIRHVAMVGRRGPLQSSFSAKELRELFSLCHTEGIKLQTNIKAEREQGEITRMQRLLMKELSQATLLSSVGIAGRFNEKGKTLSFIFYHSPSKFIKTRSNIETTLNRNIPSSVNESIISFPDGNLSNENKAAPVTISSAIVVTCLGYGVGEIPGAENIPRTYPRGPLINKSGLIDATSGLFVAGWTKTGPAGALASTMLDAYETADSLLFKEGDLMRKKVESSNWLKTTLQKRNVAWISFCEWVGQKPTQLIC